MDIGEPIKIELVLEKPGKSAHKYAVVPVPGVAPIIKTIYVESWATNVPPQKHLTITAAFDK